MTPRERHEADLLDELAYRERGEQGPIRSKRSAYYQKNKERARAYYQEHKERARAYYQERRERIKATALERYYAKVRNVSNDS